MRILLSAIGVLALGVVLAVPVHAAGAKHWSDRTLHLGLPYPGDWRVVAERGATLKLVAPDAAAEFEIYSLPAPMPAGSLAAQAEATLVRLRCGTAISRTSSTIGRLGVGGKVASGACTGGDRGWRLTVTAFNYGQRGMLVRSWLLHRQQRDGAGLSAIAPSLAGA